jgi:hypothetical protein
VAAVPLERLQSSLYELVGFRLRVNELIEFPLECAEPAPHLTRKSIECELRVLALLDERRPHFLKAPVHALEPLIDLLEPLVDLLEPLIDLLEPLVDLLEPLIDLFEPLVDLLEPLIDLFEPLIDLFEP